MINEDKRKMITSVFKNLTIEEFEYILRLCNNTKKLYPLVFAESSEAYVVVSDVKTAQELDRNN